MTKFWRLVFGTVVLFLALLGLGLLSLPDDNLHVVFCDVGQGDAILVYQGSSQILFDGGPDNSVLICLGNHIPFWDRKIEIVFATHSDADHITGLIEVLRRYEVENFTSTGLWTDTKTAQTLLSELEKEHSRELIANFLTKIKVSDIEIDIVWPSDLWLSQNLGSANFDSNKASIVALVSFGGFDVLLTGDIVPPIINELALSPTLRGEWEVLKVPHHGSKNGLTREFLEAASPNLAVISLGKDNPYGHPHKEILELLNNKAIKTLRTDLDGEVEVVSDGTKWWVE